MDDAAQFVRAGCWRRIFALLLDGLITGVLFGLVGLILSKLTNDVVRISSVPLTRIECRAASPSPGLRLPTDLRINSVAICTKSFFGDVHDRVLVVAEITRSGSTTLTRSVTFPVDSEGRPTRAYYIDAFLVLAFAIYVFFMQWRLGATFGQDFLNMRVRSLGGGRLSWQQSATRSAALLFFGIVTTANWLVAAIAPDISFVVLSITAAVCALLGIAVLANFVVTVRRRDLPWHDRFAGTEMVRG